MRFITATALAALIAAPAMAEGWKEDYQILKFGILSGENEKDRLMRNEPLRAFLEAKLGVKVEIFTAGNYDGVIQAVAADQIEVARFGSSSYAAAYTATDGGVVPTIRRRHVALAFDLEPGRRGCRRFVGHRHRGDLLAHSSCSGFGTGHGAAT